MASRKERIEKELKMYGFIGCLGYSINVFNGRQMMRYSGPGHSELDSLPNLNIARQVGCMLLPKDSKTRYVRIYNQGTTAGYLIRRNGSYLYNPTYQDGTGERKQVSYAINPNTGRVVRSINSEIKDFRF